MTTKQYRYLLTIAQYGSISQAAQALGITETALRKTLKSWEKTIGFPLFLRFHRRLTPTSVGQCVLEYGEKILKEQNRMLLTIRQAAGAEHKKICLCTAPNRAAIIYSQIINEFSRRFPDTALTLVEQVASEQPAMVRRGKANLALGAGPVSDDVEDIPFAREELLVALPASHPLASESQVRLQALQDIPFVLQGKKHSIRTIADELFEQAGFLPLIAFESDNVFLIDAMLHQAAGAGLVSKIHVMPCDELRYLSLDPPVFQLTHIRYPKGHVLTEAERYLAGLLIRHRLSDSRYEGIFSNKVEALLDAAAAEQSEPPQMMRNAGEQKVGEISFHSQVLEYLIAIQEEKSLTGAANRCYLAQPALSRYLRGVETMLGVSLFMRVHNRLMPTNAGKIFINDARNILRYEAEMKKAIETRLEGRGGQLIIVCDPLLQDIFLSRCIPLFLKTHPNLRITLITGSDESNQESLLSARADIGLFFSTSPEHPMLNQTVLGISELVYLSPRGNAPVSAFPVEQKDVHLMLASRDTSLRKAQEERIARYFRTSPRVVGESELPILLSVAESGLAGTILPADLLPPGERNLSIPFPDHESIYLILSLNPVRELPKAAKHLICVIHEVFGSFFLSCGAEDEQMP